MEATMRWTSALLALPERVTDCFIVLGDIWMISMPAAEIGPRAIVVPVERQGIDDGVDVYLTTFCKGSNSRFREPDRFSQK